MMRWVAVTIAAIGVALWAVAGHAQPLEPQIVIDALVAKLQGIEEARDKALLHAATAESRLKFVLENWVTKEPLR